MGSEWLCAARTRDDARVCRRKQQVEAQQAQMQQARAALQASAPDRSTGAAAAAGAAARRDAAAASRQEEQERERERELIRRQYLGTPHQKRKITKASDKFKHASPRPSASLQPLQRKLVLTRCLHVAVSSQRRAWLQV